MVVLVPRKTVVDDEQRALVECLDQRMHPCTCFQTDLAYVGHRHIDGSCRVEQLAGCRTIRPLQAWAHAALHDAALGPVHHVDRNRVRHFVGDHRAAETLGQALDVAHPIAELFLLPPNEIGARFQDQVFAALRE